MTEQTLKGIGVCGGISFGAVQVVDRRRVSVPHFHVPAERRGRELERFEGAVAASEAQLEHAWQRAEETGFEQVASLLRVHASMLRDDALFGATRRVIEKDGRNAEWALEETIKTLTVLFDGLEQDYLRERKSDVDLVGDRVMRNLVGAETDLLDNLPNDAIVVAYDLSPADTLALARYAARAFVTEAGGRTSHVAILARSLGVPCVLGVSGIMELAGTGDSIIVDGYAGNVVLDPTSSVSGRYRGVEKRHRLEEQALLADRARPAATTDGERVSLLGNIEVASELQKVLEYGGEGIGLYRTEFLYLERPDLSGAAGHLEAYRRVLSEHPVTIRTFDVGADKEFAGRVQNQANPALGLRAIRLSLAERHRFEEQIEGILRASAHGEVKLLLPMVSGVEEVVAARELVQSVAERLAGDGVVVANVPIGVMVETPAAVMIVDRLAEISDFLSVGTNDLVQYTLAVDRTNEDVAYLYSPCHPAVLRMLRAVLEGAADTPVSVCGEMAGDPFLSPLLIGLGVRTLSMTATSIPLVKRMVGRLSARECESFVTEALGLSTTKDVERALRDRIEVWGVA